MRNGYSKGFTLVEILVTMAIAAIILSVGVPGFRSVVQDNRKVTALNDLATSLNLARSTAVTRKIRVTVCKSSDGLNCATGNGSGDWSQGWIIFSNLGNLDAPATTADLLRVHYALPSNNISLVGSGPTVNRVSFKPQGMVDGNIGTITYCDSRGASEASALIISFGGQIRLAQNDGDGIVANGSGDPVVCPT